ncbi:hypothetical protein [Methanolapillus millepedarum]
MEIDWGLEFTKYELHIIYRIYQSKRICNRHIQEQSLCSGVKSNELGSVKKALKDLVR